MRIAVLLDLRAHGADPSDAAELAAALRACGHVPLVLVRGPRSAGNNGAANARGVMPWPGLRQYRRVEREFKPDHVVRADLGESHFAWRLAGAFGLLAHRGWRSTGIPPTNWGVDPHRARRSRLALWDGEYLLCPTAVDTGSGSALLGAFARLGEERPQLDLVVLADPQPHLVRAAERLAVGARVHFAGVATRDAEWSWLEHANAIVVLPDAPVSPGLVMRCWAVGRPPVTCHGFPCSIWVDPGRTGWCCQPDSMSLTRGLREALTPGPALRLMMDDSRRLAAERSWEHAARALDATLRRAAAVAPAQSPPTSEAREKAA